MAKREKISFDELLEEALVKEEKKPYKVPGNWVWTYFKDVVFNRDSLRIPLSLSQRESMTKKYDYYGASGIIDKVESFIFDRKLMLIGEDGANLVTRSKPIAFIAQGRYWVNNHAHVLDSNRCLLLEYLCYYINSIDLVPYVTGSAQPKMTQDKMNIIPVPFPPLPEQRRIVGLVESLFAKLDRAKELIQNALDSFENRKSAILHKALNGELTAKWREENGLDYNWESKPLKKVADFRTGYAFDSSKFCDTGYQIMRMGNLYHGVLDLSRNAVFVKKDDISESIVRRSEVSIGDILLTLTGTKYKRDYGFPVLITEKAYCLLNQRIVSLTAKSVETNYLWNYLKTDLFRNIFFSNETGGVNQGNVSSKFVETIQIPIPSISEQKEIVRILDNLHENEQRAKELCDVIENIDLMKKSILARAFRGELSTNDPNEESALELLKEVLRERVEG